MKNLNKAAVSPVDFFSQVTASKRIKNRLRLMGLRTAIVDRFNEYSDKADANKLHTLVQKWNYDKKKTTSDGYFLYSQYDNSALSISGLRARIIAANNGEIVLKCPICGIRDARDLDHYVPRQLFPEYSIHPFNLIPTCHDCNNEKSTTWCSVEGKRLIFNAYYDTPTDDFLFDVNIKREKDLLKISLSLKTFENPSESTRLALSTLNELKLLPYINQRINEIFTKRVNEICCRRKHFKSNDDDFMDMEKETFNDLISDITDINDWDRIVYMVMKDNPIVDTWIREQFN